MRLINQVLLTEKGLALGDTFRSKNGLIGTIENIQGIARLVVRDPKTNTITQTLSIGDVDLTKFSKLEKRNV